MSKKQKGTKVIAFRIPKEDLGKLREAMQMGFGYNSEADFARDALRRALENFGIVVDVSRWEKLSKTYSTRKKLPAPEELRKLYWGKGLSLAKIGKKFGVHSSAVQRSMKRYGIPTRSRPKSRRG